MFGNENGKLPEGAVSARKNAILAADALVALRNYLNDHQDVCAVEILNNSPNEAFNLVVSTRLETDYGASGIPEEYKSFPVLQRGMATRRRRFLNCYSVVLWHLLKWDENVAQQKISHLGSA